MKKRISLLLVLALALIVFTSLGATKAYAADKLQSKFFPTGEITAPAAPYVSATEGNERLILWIDQPDDIKALAVEHNLLFNKYTIDSDMSDFNVTYGIWQDVWMGVQIDVKLDGGSWLYNGEWDHLGYDSTDGLPYFMVYVPDVPFDTNDSSNYISVTAIDGIYEDSDLGFLNGYFKDGTVDLENHTFEFRVRYYVTYDIAGSEDPGLLFSDWSESVSIGKNGTVKKLKMPSKFSAPKMTELEKVVSDGKWYGNLTYNIDIPKDVSDTEKVLLADQYAFQPLYIQAEACIDDLSEKDFESFYTGNPNSIYSGSRSASISISGRENAKYLIRLYIKCNQLDKKTDYAYAIAQPKTLKAKKVKANTAVLKWAKVAEADCYEIYNGDKLVATTTKPKYNLKKLAAGTEYSYRVRAVKDDTFVGLFKAVKFKTAAK